MIELVMEDVNIIKDVNIIIIILTSFITSSIMWKVKISAPLQRLYSG